MEKRQQRDKTWKGTLLETAWEILKEFVEFCRGSDPARALLRGEAIRTESMTRKNCPDRTDNEEHAKNKKSRNQDSSAEAGDAET